MHMYMSNLTLLLNWHIFLGCGVMKHAYIFYETFSHTSGVSFAMNLSSSSDFSLAEEYFACEPFDFI